MKAYSELLAKVKKADTLFNLIEDGDRIVIGISGGKDSIVLFHALLAYKKYSKKTYTLLPVMLDLGFPHFDPTTYVKHFKELGHPLFISDSQQVAEILAINKETYDLPKLSCSICSRMKKAAINEVARQLNANKVAFAHHVDDALETLMMNMISGGRFATFKPKMFLDRANITFIRPLLFADEALITQVLHLKQLPLLTYTCPNNKKTRREHMKNLLQSIYQNYPEAIQNFRRMLTNDEALYLWYKDFATLVGRELYIKKVTTKAELSNALFIRAKVFIEEQGVSVSNEFDSNEEAFTSFVLYLKDKHVGTIRYKYDKATNSALIGRIAVLKEHRGKRYGTLLIEYVENLLKKQYGKLTFIIGGQKYLKTYYETLGYTAVGEPYLDANIWHYQMEKIV